MIETSITDAKAHLAALVDAALKGDDVVLCRLGKPVVRLIPFRDPKKTREPGGIKDIVIPSDFNDPDPDIVSMFEGGNPS